VRQFRLYRAVDDGLLQPDLIGTTAQGQEGDVRAFERLGENGFVVEGTIDDLNAVQVIERLLRLVTVTDQDADFFARGP
jgi:hypothetical protein